MNRIAPPLTPLPEGVIERLSRISSGTLTTELFRRGLKQCFLVGLTPLNPDKARFAGEAYTMRFIPAREDLDTYETLKPYPTPDNLQWEAAEAIGPGQVLVIDSRNDCRAASAGNILLTRMMVRGVAGIVTDGALRDGVEIAQMGIPAYARQVTASTRLSFHRTADLQTPISCADVAVYPGDIIVGDGDGITVIPRSLAAEIADVGEQRDIFEEYLVARVRNGEGLYGVYPPNEQTRADFAAWKQAGSDPAQITTLRAKKSDVA
jgi:regulator of RNase E activity RraA